jgi:plastocyanin
MRMILGALATVLAVAACGDDGGGTEASPARCVSVEDGVAMLVAEDLAWSPDCISAVADEPFTIRLENRDDGVNHNVHLDDAPGGPKTELEAGPVTQELDVTLPAGDYAYRCDLHPNMVGRIEVVAASSTAP